VASEVLRASPSQRPPRLLKATVRPVAQCGPWCRVRRDSALFPVFYDGLAAQCGPWRRARLRLRGLHARSSRRSSRLHNGLHDFPPPISFPTLPRCSAGRSCSGRPDVEDVALPLKPAGSLTFRVILPKGHPQVIIKTFLVSLEHILWVRILCTVRPISFNVGSTFNARQHAQGRVSSRRGPRQGPCGLLRLQRTLHSCFEDLRPPGGSGPRF
jgi:hypothetical protein